jgi:hypothetical protein
MESCQLSLSPDEDGKVFNNRPRSSLVRALHRDLSCPLGALKLRRLPYSYGERLEENLLYM